MEWNNEIKSFNDLKEFALFIENNFEVNNWKVNNIHLWPIIRIRFLFKLANFYLMDANQKTSKNNRVKEQRLPYWKHLYRGIKYLAALTRMKKAKYLFASHGSYRELHNNVYFNKFFDSLIENFGLKKEYLIYEFDYDPKKNYTHKEKIIDDLSMRKYFNSYLQLLGEPKIKIDLEGYEKFVEFLKNLPDEMLEIALNIELFEPETLAKNYYLNVIYFEKLLKKIKPHRTIFTCYYCNTTQPFLVACNRLNISNIEMQHGVQAPLHLAYNYWSNIPSNGYAAFPKYYWNWNHESAENIKQGMGQNNRKSAIVGGNPWHGYLNNKTDQVESYKDIILYTISSDYYPENYFPEHFIHLIKKNKLNIWLRLHPRQRDELGFYTQFIESKGLTDFVEIEEATKLPLPFLLKKTILHLTFNSSSFLEAKDLGIPSVILHPTGLEYYQSDNQTELFNYCSINDVNFPTFFTDILNNLRF